MPILYASVRIHQKSTADGSYYLSAVLPFHPAERRAQKPNTNLQILPGIPSYKDCMNALAGGGGIITEQHIRIYPQFIGCCLDLASPMKDRKLAAFYCGLSAGRTLPLLAGKTSIQNLKACNYN